MFAVLKAEKKGCKTAIDRIQFGPRRVESFRLVQLTPLMKVTNGGAEIGIGLIDGPVLKDHPELASEKIRSVPEEAEGRCTGPDSVACMQESDFNGQNQAVRRVRTPRRRAKPLVGFYEMALAANQSK